MKPLFPDIDTLANAIAQHLREALAAGVPRQEALRQAEAEASPYERLLRTKPASPAIH